MPTPTQQRLTALQAETANIRNVCILAHVDHGKTTLSDSLLTTNGIISSKIAGKVRYLDSREDEQERGITMESSGISLYFKVLRRIAAATNTGDGQPAAESNPQLEAHEYLINLIDSPGHVDFSSEVSTASRLSDGALVLVDVVEGVCTQTVTVLQQAWTESVRPILVLNKMDRLITELQLTPLEAYQHLCKILEQVNAVMATFLTGEILEADARKLEEAKLRMLAASGPGDQDSSPAADFDWTLQEIDDAHIYFSPELGNVIFASALHGWAFGVRHFAQLYAGKLKIKESLLRTTLWGDYYLDPKLKRIIPHRALKGRTLKPMFVQFALENIWAAYDAAIVHPDAARVEKIVQTLKLRILPRDLRTKDTQALIASLMSQWLPLATAAFLAIIDKVPSPLKAQPVRVPKLLYPFAEEAPAPKSEMERAMFTCDTTADAPVVVLVAKMFSVPVSLLPENSRQQLTAEEMRARGRVERERRTEAEAASSGVSLTDGLLTTRDGSDLKAGDGEVPPHALVGFCRVYAGQLRTGQTLYALSPKYDPNLPATLQAQYVTEVTVGRLYLLMGRELLPIETAYAGNTVGVAGLDNAVLKTATLCSVLPGPNLCSVLTGSAPIVRAALEPVHLADMPRLVRGLKLLNQSDPCVEVYVQETGEHVVAAAGELHLERCLADLRERYAGIEIHVSPPLVPFRETVAPQAHGPQAVTVTTTHRLCAITVSCRPLPPTVTKFLTDHKATIQQFWGGRGYAEASGDAVVDVLAGTGAPQARLGLVEFQQRLTDLFAEDERENRTHWGDVVPCLWLFGPKRIGPNLLLNKIPGHQVRPCYHHPSKQATRPDSPAEPDAGAGHPTAVAADLLADKVAQLEVQDNDDTDRAGSDALHRSTLADLRIRDLEEAIATGFQLATLNGPLCAEPVVGMCYIVEDCRLLTDRGDGPDLPLSTLLTTLPGQVIAATKEACRQTFLTWSPRLMLAMYDVDVQATAEVLGKVYAVLAKRRGRIVSEEMKDGTSLFQIRARLPVIESFGFADDIRKRTSGAASPQLVFSGFEALDEDPFWVPTTEEELEDLGEKADRENLAKKYVDGVRKRKGMFVEQKIVESAEKQRTLKK